MLFLAADYHSIDQKEMVLIASKLIAKGNAYLCAWGNGCSDGDTNWDIAALESESETEYGFFTMTTWHENESLEEGAWFALNVAFVDERIWADTSIVLASVGNKDWEKRIRAICDDPETFNKRALEEESVSQPDALPKKGSAD